LVSYVQGADRVHLQPWRWGGDQQQEGSLHVKTEGLPTNCNAEVGKWLTVEGYGRREVKMMALEDNTKIMSF
jgi:hypothetical protein